MDQRSDIWIIDTSSIIKIKRRAEKSVQRKIYDQLHDLVANGILVYPIQVLNELERYTNPGTLDLDLPYRWAKENQTHATRHGPQFERLRDILNHPQVRKVVDIDKAGVEEADPHVLALAQHLKEEHEVTVLTEEKWDSPEKLSLKTACGLLKIVSLPISAFLIQQGIISEGEFPPGR